MKKQGKRVTKATNLRESATSAVTSDKLFSVIGNVWVALKWLSVYRTVLALIFLVLPLFFPGKIILGSEKPFLFFIISIVYLLFSLATFLAAHFRVPRLTTQIDVFIFIDIFLLSICLHASGGVVGGLSALLIVAVAIGSVLTGGRFAFALAAVTSFIVLGEQTHRVILNKANVSDYLEAAMIGIGLFVTAFVANIVARQLEESAVLARQRGIDLENMSKLNEYIIQCMESGVVVVDERNRIRLINEAARYLLGLPGHVELLPLDEVSEELTADLQHWRKNPKHESKTFRVTGSVAIFPRFTRISMRNYEGVLILLEDTSMLDQQAQTLKMTAMGRLTASIAHEIRNPLGAISHAGQLLEESPNLDKADRRLTQIIREQSVRMNTLIENIMQLSRRDQAIPEQIHLKAWLSDFLDEFIKSQGISHDDVALHVAPEDTTVYIDPSHLHQILFNLCQNALRYGKTGSGKKAIQLIAGESQDSEGAFLDVIDNGPGIEPEMSKQIFEPFFTTAGKGTGLGLYIARELAEANQAHLDYIPVPTGGSCFRISFAREKRRSG